MPSICIRQQQTHERWRNAWIYSRWIWNQCSYTEYENHSKIDGKTPTSLLENWQSFFFFEGGAPKLYSLSFASSRALEKLNKMTAHQRTFNTLPAKIFQSIYTFAELFSAHRGEQNSLQCTPMKLFTKFVFVNRNGEEWDDTGKRAAARSNEMLNGAFFFLSDSVVEIKLIFISGILNFFSFVQCFIAIPKWKRFLKMHQQHLAWIRILKQTWVRNNVKFSRVVLIKRHKSDGETSYDIERKMRVMVRLYCISYIRENSFHFIRFVCMCAIRERMKAKNAHKHTHRDWER